MQYQPLKPNAAAATAATLPLAGRNILVTRAAHQAAQLSQALTRAGAGVIELPLIEILPPLSWAPFDAAFRNVEKYNWLLFAGVNAVKFTVARLQQIEKLAAAQSQLAVAAVGDATAQAARTHGFNVRFHPLEFTGAALVKQLVDFLGLGSGGGSIKIIWPRTNIGSAHVVDELRKSGAQVDTVECYRTTLSENKNEIAEKLAALLLNNSIDVITLNSAQTARNFYLLLGLDSRCASSAAAAAPQDAVDLQALLASVIIAAIGPETSAVAKQLLGRVDIEAKTHTIDGLVDELIRCLGCCRPLRI